MPQLDTATYTSQIFWLCVSFLTMFFIMSKFIVPKINDILSQRQRKIDDYLTAANEFKMSAEAIIDKYEEALEKANEKAEAAMNKAQENMKKTLEQAEQDADRRLKAKLEKGEEEISSSKEEIMAKIETISFDLAELIVQKIGIETLSKDDIKKSIKQEANNE